MMIICKSNGNYIGNNCAENADAHGFQKARENCREPPEFRFLSIKNFDTQKIHFISTIIIL